MKTSLVCSLLVTFILLPGVFASAQAPATPAPTGAKPKWQKVLPQTPPGFTMMTREVAVYPELTVMLTLYVPDKAGRYPAILDIHGG
jgi:pectinesterase